MSAAIFQAAVPEPFTIFGVRLLPFSLGRYRLLSRFDCAFVAEGASEASISDLVLGVAVCGMRCDEFLSSLADGSMRRVLKRWGRRIRREVRRDPEFSYLQKFHLFARYVQESAKIPDHYVERENDTPPGSHWSHSVEVVLRSELGYTVEEIEEGPMSKALADYFKWAESQGFIRLMAEGEKEQGEANLKVMLEALKKGGVPWPSE